MKIQINKKKTEMSKNLQKLSNTLVHNQQLKEEIKRDIKKYLERNENKNTTHQKLWDATKDILRGKFILINTYIKKLEDSPKNLTSLLKELEKGEESPKLVEEIE